MVDRIAKESGKTGAVHISDPLRNPQDFGLMLKALGFHLPDNWPKPSNDAQLPVANPEA